MNSTQIGIFKQTHQISFSGFLKSTHCGTLEPQVRLEVLSDFSNKTLEGQFANKQVGRLLVSSNLAQCYCSWAKAMWLLHSSSRRGALACSLGGQLLPWCFATGGLASCLLCSCLLIQYRTRHSLVRIQLFYTRATKNACPTVSFVGSETYHDQY